jgi:hypothetical protein
MTPKPKARKAPATNTAIDPIFAAIAEHKALIKENDRLEGNYRAAVAKAEKRHGKQIKWAVSKGINSWPGEAKTSPLYDEWNRADCSVRKAGRRLARTKPATLTGLAALADYIHTISRGDVDEINEDLVKAAVKTIATKLARMREAA